MPKKQVRNAFYFFMKDLEPQLRREGRVFNNGLQDVVPIAHPRWKALPDKDKERYEKMAKDYKAKMRGGEGDQYKMDNVGNIIAHRKDPYTELEKRRLAEKKQMRASWPPGKELADVNFYFINLQYLCVTEEEEYLPCEIAIIEYSLRRGITKKLHRFIEPGKIPTGYRFTCIQHSEDTHQIPVENFSLADNNYRGLWIQMENFINPNGEKPEYPPLYCLGAGGDYKAVEYGLLWIHNKAMMGRPGRIKKVYEVESLLQEMNAHIGNNVAKSQCVELLTSTCWDYEINTRCEYHEEKECKDCALGVVQRYAYAISDCMCEHFGVELTQNHLPVRDSLDSVTVLSPSSMPVERNQEARISQRAPQFSKPTAKPQPVPQAIKQEVDDDDDVDYTSLRRPNIPNVMAGPVPPPAASAVSWGAMMGVMGDNSRTLQPMGRGMSVAVPGAGVMNTFAGSQPTPGAARVPAPPSNWSQPGVPQQRPMTSQLPRMMSQPAGMRSQPPDITALPSGGLGRGMMVQAPREVSAPPIQRTVVAPAPVIPLPRAESNSSSSSSVGATSSKHFSRQGRGRGAILSKIMKDGCRPGVPVGRGFAPPGWDDSMMRMPVRP